MTVRASARLILPIIALALAFGVYHALLAGKTEREKPVLSEKIWQVSAIEARRESLSPTIMLYGKVESPELLQAGSPGTGVVERVLVRAGHQVQRGQLLIELDQRDFEAALLQAEADLRDIDNQIKELNIAHEANLRSLATERDLMALAEDEVARLVKLKQNNLTSETELNGARSELGRQRLAVTARELDVKSFPARLQILEARRDRAEARRNQDRLAVTRSAVRAPFDAIISRVLVSAGDRVSLGQTLVSLYPRDSLEIRAHLPANHIDAVQQALAQGRVLEASVSGRPQLERLPVRRIAGEAEATGIDIFFATRGGGVRLRPGELLSLQLQLPAQDGVFAVPYQAIYGNSRIYRIVDGRLQAIDVETVGQTRDAAEARVLIRSDQLADGDRIATTHLPNAVAGLKVSVDGD